MRFITEVVPAEVVEDERDDVEDEAEAQLLAHAPAVREVARGELEKVAGDLFDRDQQPNLAEREAPLDEHDPEVRLEELEVWIDHRRRTQPPTPECERNRENESRRRRLAALDGLVARYRAKKRRWAAGKESE